ncbi:unnamed protein product [Sphenostylis stenocarpa]|uniref:Uncharacterized protein n=1 Tax=Sphenostylis stenocarpa TaxID=92480 RepID=A0AA86SWJ2_9FABA|nr:unnamed protein product [Sphenostylis stenocarpa]
MYGKCGNLNSARVWFNQMSNWRDRVSWNALLASNGHHQLSKQALSMFSEMQWETKPTKYTLGTLLLACANTFSLYHGKQIHGPDGKLLAVLGDSTEFLIADANTGKITGSLKGHLDYSFASAWHPDGRILATGNQDTTCRLWDIRNLSQSIAVLKGRMRAITALRFTSDGRFLAMAEPADLVHFFDSHSGYVRGQEIDLFGEIAGISFSPDTEAPFVGIADRTYGRLLEFVRKRYNYHLDSMF